jgi:glycosyltransferase involved in cell wall biosynthesis
MTAVPAISVVVPFNNEAESAAEVVTEIVTVLEARGDPFEVVLVDDGSVDGTTDILRQVAARLPCCRLLILERCSGQGAALWHGLHVARGDILVTLDGDGQNDPADIPAMIDRLQGVDIVLGVRARRRDTLIRRRMTKLANAVRRRWLRDHATDAGCALKVFRREVLSGLIPIQTLYSFIPACAVAAGFRSAEYPVHHRPRVSGRSHYSLRAMLWRPFVDMVALGWLNRRRIPRVNIREESPRI